MASQSNLAVVTGASTGIGYELAKSCAANDFDLVVVADEPEIKKAARDSGKARRTMPRMWPGPASRP
jgi:uncharacterized protein